MSPLEILGKAIWPAFSHKELMVPFGRTHGLYCQNDEVSTVCARVFRTSDLPLVDLSEVLLDHVLSDPRPDILNGLEIRRFTGDYAANGFLRPD